MIRFSIDFWDGWELNLQLRFNPWYWRRFAQRVGNEVARAVEVYLGPFGLWFGQWLDPF
jgi:hypothetical protein